MLMRTISLAAAMLLLALPAQAQDAAACRAAATAHRQAAVAVAQQAKDVAAALVARAGLAEQEAAARTACDRIPQIYGSIDVTKEDVDLTLGAAVPACKTAIDAAAPHVQSAGQIARTGDKEMASKLLGFLTKARADAEIPCKDYPGVLGRILRAENMMGAIKGPN
jgi:hypothetical protein